MIKELIPFKRDRGILFKGLILFLILFMALIIISNSRITTNHKKEKIMDHQIILENLPTRKGDRPRTTNTNPHTQLNQQPEDLSYIQSLMDWAFDLGHIEKRPSAISVPGSIAMWMDKNHTCKSCNAFMIGTEFAHFHPHPDRSMHLGLSEDDATTIINKGWGEWHPLIKRGFLPPNIIMLYAPRDQKELDVSKIVLKRSYAFAKGELEK
ncbi:MAG: hypothetical protein AAGA77_02785 [Bacteroidota bacterium]